MEFYLLHLNVSFLDLYIRAMTIILGDHQYDVGLANVEEQQPAMYVSKSTNSLPLLQNCHGFLLSPFDWIGQSLM